MAIVGGADIERSERAARGNLFGTNAAGNAVLYATNNLIFIEASANNTIGGTTAAARNVITGAGNGGIYLDANRGTARAT